MWKLLAISFLLLSTAVFAQEVGYLDLTGVTPRTNLRYPPSPPPKVTCKNLICSGIGGGFASTAIACGFGRRDDPRAIQTTVTWLDRLDYHIDDNIEFEIK